MFKQKFSIQEAYSFGVKSVLDHFTFFVMAIGVGSGVTLLFMSFLGIIDYAMFREHFETIVKAFSHAIQEPTGSLHVANNTIGHHIKDYAPAVFSKHLVPRDVLSIDISREDIENILKILIPSALLLKVVLQAIAIGWTKLALDLEAKKKVDYDYLYKFYYLVPRVLIVDIIVGTLTVMGLFFFIIPGVIVYQRLRFARYFIIDKNQSCLQSLESSWALTDGSVLHLTGYTLFAAMLKALGNVIFLLHFFLLPLSYQAEASVYRQMIK
ncbi:MAG: hypothetical protein CL947_01500 [Epsilonproteobacteria bacterium]|nr:hypothetical protein [Campylobacterota bacterium]|tara:strand:- start:1067 stop:1870 length:804 start_codon:yes stop_codon:yes gene_type:complete